MPGVEAPHSSGASPDLEATAAFEMVDAQAYEDLRRAPLFDGIAGHELNDAILSGEVELKRIARDRVIPFSSASLYLQAGQVAFAFFPEAVLADERKVAEGKLDKKEEKKRAKLGPLFSRVERSLTHFEPGDLLEPSSTAERHPKLACYTVTPVSLIAVAGSRIAHWKRVYPFFADRLRRAAASAHMRLDASDGARALVADFFVRHGLSVAQTLRVREIDKCVECGACEAACEERYGVKRLSLNGRVLGRLDFVDACHTCTDQRCIDPCAFDAIKYDSERREVIIVEPKCTGCTLCSTACPYDAIEMHDLEETPRLKQRLERDGALAFGEGTPRKARLKRLASKCDHCISYQDQACISACPTGALLEVTPDDALRRAKSREAARQGFMQTVLETRSGVTAFIQGLDVPEFGRARAPRGRVHVWLWWTLGLLTVGLSGLEVLLRAVAPEWSFAFFAATVIDHVPPRVALLHIDYHAGSELARAFGYTGTALLGSGMLYALRNRWPRIESWGTIQDWFDWHVMAGVVGTLFILLHSAARFNTWVVLALVFLFATVASGIVGHYLTAQVAMAAQVATLEVAIEERRLAKLLEKFPSLMAAAEWLEVRRKRAAALVERLGKTNLHVAHVALGWLIVDEIRRLGRRIVLGAMVRRATDDDHIRASAIKTITRLLILDRRRALLPLVEPLFRFWKAVHIPCAVLFTILAVLHICLA
jgi:Fe-S-cluster-containing hydrogenase component 2